MSAMYGFANGSKRAVAHVMPQGVDPNRHVIRAMCGTKVGMVSDEVHKHTMCRRCVHIVTPENSDIQYGRSLVDRMIRADCYECWKATANEYMAKNPKGFPATRMIVCLTCGSKRCPRAGDHRNQCQEASTTGAET